MHLHVRRGIHHGQQFTFHLPFAHNSQAATSSLCRRHASCSQRRGRCPYLWPKLQRGRFTSGLTLKNPSMYCIDPRIFLAPMCVDIHTPQSSLVAHNPISSPCLRSNRVSMCVQDSCAWPWTGRTESFPR